MLATLKIAGIAILIPLAFFICYAIFWIIRVAVKSK